MTEWSFTYNGLWYTSCGALAGTAMSKSGLMVACLNHTWIPADIVNREIEWSGVDLLKKNIYTDKNTINLILPEFGRVVAPHPLSPSPTPKIVVSQIQQFE